MVPPSSAWLVASTSSDRVWLGMETVCMPAAGRGINLRKLPILKLKADLTVSAHSEIVYEANATQGKAQHEHGVEILI